MRSECSYITIFELSLNPAFVVVTLLHKFWTGGMGVVSDRAEPSGSAGYDSPLGEPRGALAGRNPQVNPCR